jgi:hypothetical protein
MSIQRWMIIAALLALAGCSNSVGPSYSCSFVSRADYASTGYDYCPGTGADPAAAGIFPQAEAGQ